MSKLFPDRSQYVHLRYGASKAYVNVRQHTSKTSWGLKKCPLSILSSQRRTFRPGRSGWMSLNGSDHQGQKSTRPGRTCCPVRAVMAMTKERKKSLALTIGKVTTFNRSSAASKYADGNAYQYSDGKYIMGLEVYHGLHCVDTLRKFLWPDHYKQTDPEDQLELHRRKYRPRKKQKKKKEIIHHTDILAPRALRRLPATVRSVELPYKLFLFFVSI